MLVTDGKTRFYGKLAVAVSEDITIYRISSNDSNIQINLRLWAITLLHNHSLQKSRYFQGTVASFNPLVNSHVRISYISIFSYY